MGPLRLERPLVTFDIESTGLHVSRDRIVEIAAIKLMPDGTVEVKGPQRLNPGVPMSAEVTAIHGIRDADVADAPAFADVAAEWLEFLEGCDLHGYNAKKFDVPMLRNEFRRCGFPNFPPLGVAVVDSFRIFCLQHPRNLAAAVALYCGGAHGTADSAHTALADARATLRVLVEQVRWDSKLPREAAALAAVCSGPTRAQDVTGDGKFQWRGDVPIVAFGKHSGEPLAALMLLHKDYLRWMSGQDFSDEALIVVDQALRGLLPAKGGGWEPLLVGTAEQQEQQRQQLRGQLGEGQQQQQPTGAGPSTSAAAGSGGEQRGTTSASQQQRHKHRHKRLPPQEELAALCSPGAAGDGNGISGGSPQAGAAPAAAGWPALDAASVSLADSNPDSWSAPAAPAATPASPPSAAPDTAEEANEHGAEAAEAEAEAASPSRSSSGTGSPDSWSFVETAPAAAAAPLQEEPSNPEPQLPQEEPGPGEGPGGEATAAAAAGGPAGAQCAEGGGDT